MVVMAGPILCPQARVSASAECAGAAVLPRAGRFGSWRRRVSGKESARNPLSPSLKNIARWIPVFAIAADLGYSASVIRRRMRASGATPARACEVSAPRPGRISLKEAGPAPAVPVAPVVRPVRTRDSDLSAYSNINCVERRMPGIPRAVLLDPADTLKFSGDCRATAGYSFAASSFRLMFPAPDAEESAASPPSYSGKELAMAVYAETGGLFPAKLARGSVYDPAYWTSGFNSGGTGDLMLARRMVAETRKRNKRTHLKAFPADLHRLRLLSWYPCAEAAEDAVGAELYPLPPGTRLHFFIRQDGVGRQKPGYLATCDPVRSFGPFVNVGGGDVPRGDKTYVDFYVLPAR